MSAEPASPDHLHFRRLPFQLRCDEALFSTSEVETLQKYGSWMDALMEGVIAPETPSQEAFVLFCRGKRRAETEFELLWRKYRLEAMFRNAQQMEAALPDGKRQYAEVRKAYLRLARMGHAGARQWMEKEGPWVNYRSRPFGHGTLISHAWDPDSTNTLGRRAPGSFGAKYGPGQGPVDSPAPIDDS